MRRAARLGGSSVCFLAIRRHRLRPKECGIADFVKMRKLDNDFDIKLRAAAFIVGVGGTVNAQIISDLLLGQGSFSS